MFQQIVYNSFSRPYDISSEVLHHILTGARKRNLELAITGLLLFHNGEFLQLLEGPREAVSHLYHDIIVRDLRHVSPVICFEGSVENRSFAQWSMGFSTTADASSAEHVELSAFLHDGGASLDSSQMESPGGRLLLHFFAQMQKSRFQRYK